jgi:stearoyl-CoA desaturase (delta-9 desaturase)
VSGKLFSSNVGAFVLLHMLALLAFVPWLFTWTGVVLVFVGNYVFGSLGINLGYHRLLTHRSFQCPKWLERTFSLLGACSLQDSPIRWVAAHRMHHQHSDTHTDPHSPLVSFLWGHVGWLVLKNRRLRKRSTLAKYAPDLLEDPFQVRLHRHRFWLWVYVVHAALFLGAGCSAGWMMTGTAAGALQFGLSVFVWGVVVRTVYTWHVSWAGNSLTHRFGYRNYETGENSRNNWLVALLSHGEGWHNNHHADQRSARHGRKWWEIDPNYWVIALLRAIGLATNVAAPNDTARPVTRSSLSTSRRADTPHALLRGSLASTKPDSSRTHAPASTPQQNR